MTEIWPGSPYPLGAAFDGSGTNFSVFSRVAERVDLCLFDDAGRETRVPLPETTSHCWHGYAPEVGQGQRYGFRVYGPYAPAHGLRCNPNKLLLDPYAKAVEGQVHWHPSVYDYEGDGDPPTWRRNDLDSAPHVPKGIVIAPFFDWDKDRPPKTPWHETVIYELHVKSFTRRMEDIPPPLRGTYAGLAHPAAVEYLKALGVTAVELLPVHQFVHDHALVRRGLTNHWGYQSIGYFAPHSGYASRGQRGEQVLEFKHMVKTLHRAGIEVILDVVYNHTAEQDHAGPSLCFRGLDNRSYYRLLGDPPWRHQDFTGCGNSLNMLEPHVLQLIMDSLRYFVLEMHVDGFRFDLASALARELHEVDRLSAFFDIVQQDPVISQVKLIAEPWDLGEGGYQVGNFPSVWSEWNGKYRDTVRDFWRGKEQTVPELGYRLTGSSDLYEPTGRRPFASINFVTCHDGFTLRDLVSYENKHNEANGEANRDGDSHNRSWNCGAEGETQDPEVLLLRARQQRNFLVTLMISQGVPMLYSGDEIGRTQRGNNNAYCQDNEISWLDWANRDEDLLSFTRDLIALRNRHPVFRRRRWFQGQSIRGHHVSDIGWFRPDGEEMGDEDWRAGHAQALSVFLNGHGIASLDPTGRVLMDDSFLLLLNANHQPVTFVSPSVVGGEAWELVLRTDEPRFSSGRSVSGSFEVAPSCTWVLKRTRAPR